MVIGDRLSVDGEGKKETFIEILRRLIKEKKISATVIPIDQNPKGPQE